MLALRLALIAVLANAQTPVPMQYRSKVTIFDVTTQSKKVVHTGDGIIEAPNWSKDGKHLLVNTRGDLFRLPLDNPALVKIELEGGPYRANNDHDLSPDGKRIAFSASTASSRQSQVYVANADGTGVKLVVPTRRVTSMAGLPMADGSRSLASAIASTRYIAGLRRESREAAAVDRRPRRWAGILSGRQIDLLADRMKGECSGR
jgi:Tol biopolymer transport system component